MKKVTIKTLRIEDYDSIIALWRRAGLPFRPKGRDRREEIERQMTACPDLFVGAYIQSSLVGVAVGSFDGRLKGWINRLAVDPGWRRQGIARELVSEVERVLKEHEVAIFGALIEIPNEESTKFFQEMGYTPHPDILYMSKRQSRRI
jgi:ribosomal protein S18 acetylase RimI-like enzyme